MKNRNIFESFRNAGQGIKTAFQDERNFRIEIYLGMIAVIMGVWLKINVLEWTAVVFCIMLVVVSEMVNSALEHLVNLFSPEYHDLARKAKDISAGAVLMISAGAGIIGCMIFLPKLIEKL